MLAYLVLQLLFAAEPGRRLDALLCHTTVDNCWQFYFTPCFRDPLTQICKGAQPLTSNVQGGCSPPANSTTRGRKICQIEVLLLKGHAQIWTMPSYCIEPFEHQQKYIPHATVRVPEVVTFIPVLLLGGFQGIDLWMNVPEYLMQGCIYVHEHEPFKHQQMLLANNNSSCA